MSKKNKPKAKVCCWRCRGKGMIGQSVFNASCCPICNGTGWIP